MQPVTVNRYFPRSSRCGVFSNFTEVNGRALGPRNGRHPIEMLINTVSNKMTATNPTSRNRPRFFILSSPRLESRPRPATRCKLSSDNAKTIHLGYLHVTSQQDLCPLPWGSTCPEERRVTRAAERNSAVERCQRTSSYSRICHP